MILLNSVVMRSQIILIRLRYLPMVAKGFRIDGKTKLSRKADGAHHAKRVVGKSLFLVPKAFDQLRFQVLQVVEGSIIEP